ncbi:hypothetical protein TPHA_0H02100 [Tetrapisispora phaffii CBS 4417]|uniref:Protein ROT1 n=1 Tax=Tetrapisispora phaffii (strain ATCC 24235 / CBS 4417 / NBRC 1672 / NRRL Y-8282 / UCD 70-5) TaxID=1071381 RepID=G8BWG3_TETPH|nr:hypothetical protein TPHA_0H02100 [Tetrapisispora phaffii CBS 4417]CCE64414.1 hypothetical protein TPHA_0H02100 [Tetrapisispora phaffii CBS 4417]
MFAVIWVTCLLQCLLMNSIGVVADDSVPDYSGDTLHGTWSSKSNQVFTGPGFYDPVDELLIEPSLPGISISFTEDGFYEEAWYRVAGNAKDPRCPTAVLIFQHGKYEVLTNGTLKLYPFEVDGRQLLSDPCNDGGVSAYTRYSQVGTYLSFYTVLDDYHGVFKLQLFEFDGTPLQPLYLAYRPPIMLPTITLNPTASGSEDSSSDETSSAVAKRSLRSLVKRNLENRYKTNAVKKQRSIFNSSTVWYACMTVICICSAAFIFS